VTTIRWRVDELAARRGWGARRLAEAAGLDRKTVRNILAGRATRVDLDTIARLAEALDVKPGALWRTEPDRVGAWHGTAGAAGRAGPGELDHVLDGTWPDDVDPALERATRPT
jgi:DNA-binding Xre family transcriptional regulator